MFDASLTVTKRTPFESNLSINVVSAKAAPGVKTPPLQININQARCMINL